MSSLKSIYLLHVNLNFCSGRALQRGLSRALPTQRKLIPICFGGSYLLCNLTCGHLRPRNKNFDVVLDGDDRHGRTVGEFFR